MKILVMTFIGETITLNVNRSHAIAKVKAEIHALEGLSPNQQRLTFAGNHLDDDKTLADYSIQEGSTLHLLRFILSSVEMPTGEAITIEVECSSSVDKVKAKLIDLDSCCEGCSTLADYSFEKNPSEKYVLLVHEGARLLRITVTKNTITVEAERGRSITTIAGNNEKDRTTIFRMVLRLRVYGMQIFVKTPFGETFSLEVECCDSIDDVMAKIEEKTGIPPCHQRLLHDGKLLGEEMEEELWQTLADSHIQNQSIIEVVSMDMY